MNPQIVKSPETVSSGIGGEKKFINESRPITTKENNSMNYPTTKSEGEPLFIGEPRPFTTKENSSMSVNLAQADQVVENLIKNDESRESHTKTIVGNENGSQTHEALEFLRFLGCDEPNRIFHLRTLDPKNPPEGVARGFAQDFRFGWFGGVPILSSSREEQLKGERAIERLVEINQTQGIYVVINAGGRKNDSIRDSRFIFFECDHATIAEQWKALRELEAELGQPASRVTQAKKSLHVYFKLPESITPEEFNYYQLRLIAKMDSDPCLHNPARVMRVPGFDHLSYDENGLLVRIPVRKVQHTDSIFDIKTLDKKLPQISVEKKEKGEYKRKASKSVDAQGNELPEVVDIESPWDARNLFEFQEGAGQNSPNGSWHKCKCPAHNGESFNSLHVNFDTGAYKCQADCSNKAVRAAMKDVAVKAGYKPDATVLSVHQQVKKAKEIKREGRTVVEVNSRYLSDADIAIPDTGLVVLKSPKGTGKSIFMSKLTFEMASKGKLAFMPVHRTQLGRALCKTMSIVYFDKEEGYFHNTSLGCCFNQLHEYSGLSFLVDYFSDKDLILDEACQGIDYVLAGSIFKKNEHGPIVRNLIELMRQIIANGNRVIAADADMDEATVQFLEEACGQKAFVVINNYKETEPRKAYSYDSPKQLLGELKVQAAAGKKLFVVVDVQKTKNANSAKNIASALLDSGIPAICVDSETTKNPDHPAYKFADNINENCSKYQVVVTTPVLGTGVSIDVDHFDEVFVSVSGTLTPDEVMQAIARVRAKVPVHFYCRKTGSIVPGSAGYKTPSGVKYASITARTTTARILQAQVYLDPSLQFVFDHWALRSAWTNKANSVYREYIRPVGK